MLAASLQVNDYCEAGAYANKLFEPEQNRLDYSGIITITWEYLTITAQ